MIYFFVVIRNDDFCSTFKSRWWDNKILLNNDFNAWNQSAYKYTLINICDKCEKILLKDADSNNFDTSTIHSKNFLCAKCFSRYNCLIERFKNAK